MSIIDSGRLSGSLNQDRADREKVEDMETEEYSSVDGSLEEEYTDKIKPPQTLKDLVDALHLVFSRDKVNVEFVKTLMTLYKSNSKDWKKFAKFDKYRYTRNLVDAGNDKFNLMVLCWNEGQGSSIHSHSNAHCFLKVLDGSGQEEMFEWPSDSEGEVPMRSRGVNKYERNQVTYINDELGLHRVENPSHTDKLVTLHLYSPPFNDCLIFDQNTGHQNTCQSTFWSKFGHRTPFGKSVEPATENPENN